jgi:hypothetical protein
MQKIFFSIFYQGLLLFLYRLQRVNNVLWIMDHQSSKLEKVSKIYSKSIFIKKNPRMNCKIN